jgi:GNAT superfamily N-acetyltransferase
MKLLIDTNIFIPLEPTAEGDLGPGTEPAVRFASRAQTFGCTLFVHPASRDDIDRDKDDRRRRLRTQTFQKYAQLPDPPPITPDIEALIGSATPQSNDWVDDLLLVALRSNAADWLVSEDARIHKKAKRLQVADRVFRVREALTALEQLFGVPQPPPAVRAVKAHAVNRADSILDSIRRDYSDFDVWLDKCAREHRQAWIVEADGQYGGLTIINNERAHAHGLSGKVLKICTFKVSERHNGFRYGELLLKTVFDFAVKRGFDHLFVEAFEKHEPLVALLSEFGFDPLPERTTRGELVLAKPMKPDPASRSMSGLDLHRRFGPHAVRLDGTPAFLIPIQPRYHRILFPEAEPQLELAAGASPAGNAIRKAYLCLAPSRQIRSGDNLLFYRSQGDGLITVLGVVEETLATRDPQRIAAQVGKRTVYSFAEIRSMCDRGEVLAILFRQARILAPALPLDDAVREGFAKGPPQSIVRLPDGTGTWLTARIGP